MFSAKPPTADREWVSFWIHQSVRALARLTGRPLEWQAGEACCLPALPVPSDAGVQVVVYVRASDPWCRLWAVGWPGTAVERLVRWLLPSPSRMPESTPEYVSESSLRGSALLEAGNVMAGTFFTAVAGYANRALLPAPPGLIVGDAATCRARLQALTADETGTWVVWEGRLTDAGQTCPQWVAVFLREA